MTTQVLLVCLSLVLTNHECFNERYVHRLLKLSNNVSEYDKEMCDQILYQTYNVYVKQLNEY
jgi:hypothetical protein